MHKVYFNPPPEINPVWSFGIAFKYFGALVLCVQADLIRLILTAAIHLPNYALALLAAV